MTLIEGRALTRPRGDELERYRKLLEDLALVTETGNRLTLALAETQVADDERQAFLLHVAMAIRAASRANQMILGWCLGGAQTSISLADLQRQLH